MSKYTSFKPSEEQNSKSNSSVFSTKNPIVMGILNVTEDSFFDGGKYKNEKQIINRCKKILEEGASIIDIGAQSSRPGATLIQADKELLKLIPIIKLLKTEIPEIIISIDTFWAKTAKECIEAGAHIINDISAGEMDASMFDTIAELQIPYVIMHMQGTSKNMQNNPAYNNVVNEVIIYFKEKIKQLKSKGIQQIIIDPGFGFGKTLTHNYQILNALEQFNQFEIPVLVGTSRKSMIYNLLDTKPTNALNGTSITNTIALQKGASILRVHDVKEAMECIKITTFA
ncbi:MAG: dihydropteroate synthase, partial [Flavobacteriales bacterium]|nr:dihydropteroate synthase [Flavobacteriales bacterium]